MKRPKTELERFLTADYEKRFALLQDPQTKAAIETWMGSDALAEFTSQAPDFRNLGAGPKNIVFVPGVMGSTLESKGLGGVWWLDIARARNELDQLGLTSDGSSDINPDAVIAPGAIDISYVPFHKAIAASGVFGGSIHFPYDWRKSLRASATALRDVILRTHEDYGTKVHLVGHSMGGLMLRTALMLHGNELWPKVDRIVFIGTPHYGAAAIAGYLKNHLWGWEQLAILGMFLSRDTFRTLRGVLSLLPAPHGIYPGSHTRGDHPCANFDMYAAGAWNLDLDAAATVHLQNVLDEVRQFHADLRKWHEDLSQHHKDQMLIIAGVGQETLFRLELDKRVAGFLWKHTRKITTRVPCDPNLEGDGRVPVASAKLEDVQIRYINGVHGSLQNIPAVAQDVLAWLTGNKLRLAQTCQEALGGHLGAQDETPPTPHLDRSGVRNCFRDLPEYENPTPEFRARIEAEIEAGHMPEINLTKIL